MVVHVEPWGEGYLRQWIVINLRGSLRAMSYVERKGGWVSRGHKLLIHAPAIEHSIEVLMAEDEEDWFNCIDVAGSQRAPVGTLP